MTRSILVLIAAGVFVSVVAGSGCSGGGVGDPCVPEQEYDTCFGGFQIGEVNVESKSFQCQTRLCLVNHFQGRVSCPYGQLTPKAEPLTSQCGVGVTGGNPTTFYAASDYAPGITPATCTIPGGSTILGDASAELATYQVQVAVPPQVFERNTAQAVYCSCRCANESGYPVDPSGTPDDAVYCTCPDNFTCTQLVTSIGGNLDQGLTGRYCMKTGTGYEPASTTCESDPPTGTDQGCCKVPGTCCQPYGNTCGSSDNASCNCN